jgi:hypothetical protein
VSTCRECCPRFSPYCRLADVHLLLEPEEPVERPSRRVAIQDCIAAAIVLPLVTSIVAPTSAQAASCLHNSHAPTTQCAARVFAFQLWVVALAVEPLSRQRIRHQGSPGGWQVLNLWVK